LRILEAGSIFVFFAVVSGVLKEEKRRVMENELLKTKLRFLQAQISPHFLFNALNTISAICNREKAPEASKLILHLANFFRRALKRIEEQITVAEELTYIDSYLELEKARFQERLKIVKKIKVSDESVETPIPFLVIQPLVENAIKHGISKKEEGGTLEIRVYEEAEMLIFEIHDDGIGCPDQKIKEILSSEKREHGAGIGLYNIDQRLRQIYGENFGLKFHTELDQGMTMKVMIPKSSKIE
jgi:sensor histidine kinase YesM